MYTINDVNNDAAIIFKSIGFPDKKNEFWKYTNLKKFQSINMTEPQKFDLSQDSLKAEAENIYGSMDKNPLFSSMMKSMDPDSHTQEASNETSETGDTREKLKQKIKEKQDMRNKK